MKEIERTLPYINSQGRILVEKKIKKTRKSKSFFSFLTKKSGEKDISHFSLEYSLEYNNSYSEINSLEQMKKKGYINSYGEGAVLNDYPLYFCVGMRFLAGKEEQSSWGYVSRLHDKRIAFQKALYEAAERSASVLSEAKFLLKKSRYYLGDATWLFPLIPHATSKQNQKYPFLVGSADDLREALGVYVRPFGKLRKKFLPLHVFYYGEVVTSRTQKFIQQPTSNGGAAGQTLSSARVRALCELIERDHFLLYWLSGVSPRKIIGIEKTKSPRVASLLNDAKKFGLDISFYDLSYDCDISVVLCICIDTKLSLVACGAKCSQSIDDNIEGSYLEAFSVLSATRVREYKSGWKDMDREKVSLFPFLDETMDRKKRVSLYSTKEGVEYVRSFFINANYLHYEELVNKREKVFSDEVLLKKIVRNIKSNDTCGEYDVFFLEQENFFTKELAVKVVHAYVPAFLKLYLHEHFAAPVSDRLKKFAREHGKNLIHEEDINPLPHFFP